MREHHRHRRPSNRNILLMAALAVVLYVGILLGINGIGNRLEQSDVAEPVGSLEGRFDEQALTLEVEGKTWTYREKDLTNLLFIGVDWNEERLAVADSRYEGQADFLLLMTLDKANQRVTTLQIDRDTMTDIRIYGAFGDYAGTRRTQVCLAYAFGGTAEEGCEHTAWAVSQLLGGIPIDGYIAMNMEGINALNEALGGVTVTVQDDLTNADPAMQIGATLTLQGAQAETFVRTRMGVADGTNQSRMRRQSAFLTSAIDQMTAAMSEDMNYVSELLDAMDPYLTSDEDRGWLINRAYEARDYEREAMISIPGRHDVGEDGFVQFTADEDSLTDLMIQHYFE